MTIQVVLTDIEGTTSSISFVHEVLFPYSKEALPGFLSSQWEDPTVATLVQECLALSDHEGERSPSSVASLLTTWIDENRKTTPLKTLQGLIWKEGYHSGALQAHLYPEVPENLTEWHRRGMTLAVFSSGSIAAQQLLFAHTTAGDLTPLFSHYFDTTSGPKREEASYTAIASALHTPPSSILFLSDIAEELDAAHKSGMKTVQLVRAQDGTIPAPHHTQAKDFSEVHELFFSGAPHEQSPHLP
ncbi:acireductone synthase [bacterium]|nr:acireductone synthase [bacterium]